MGKAPMASKLPSKGNSKPLGFAERKQPLPKTSLDIKRELEE